MKRLSLILFIFILLALGFPMASKLKSIQDEQNRLLSETALERSLSLCYAQEGFYPAQWTYLRDHYGLTIDTTQFYVYYKTIGSNIRPDVEIYLLGDSP